MILEKIALIEATKLFENIECGENVNYSFCLEYGGRLYHSHSTEFVLRIRDEEGTVYNQVLDKEPKTFVYMLRRMQIYHCSPAFVQAYIDAKEAGASYVLFYY